MTQAGPSRRPLASRDSTWARSLAGWLASRRVRPNAISLASVAFAAAAAACFLAVPSAESSLMRAVLFVCGAAAIQIRLVCNLLDGMVAMDGGLKSRSGDVFNDLPDRVADPLILVACGYSVADALGPALGWAAALLAVLTAYVRVLGASLGLPHDYGGPMAKPQRMAVLTIGCLAEAAASFANGSQAWPLTGALGIVAAGSLVTIAARTRRLLRALEAR